MLGDTVFLGGVGALVWFLVGLVSGHSYDVEAPSAARAPGAPPLPAE